MSMHTAPEQLIIASHAFTSSHDVSREAHIKRQREAMLPPMQSISDQIINAERLDAQAQGNMALGSKSLLIVVPAIVLSVVGAAWFIAANALPMPAAKSPSVVKAETLMPKSTAKAAQLSQR